MHIYYRLHIVKFVNKIERLCEWASLTDSVCLSVSVASVCVYFHVRQEILGQDAACEEERCSNADVAS